MQFFVSTCIAVLTLLFYSSASFATPTKLSEMQAIELLAKKTNKDFSYPTWIRPNCIDYYTEKSTANYFEFALHEKHNGHCAGVADPLTWPVIDRFRVYRNGKKILWYDAPTGEYVPYERGIENRKPKRKND
jgi:hypothetical protein